MAKTKKDESKFSIKVPKIKVSKKTYDFSLSLPGMISAVGAGVLALTFFFVMGILIGRGYRPEADVPQLKEIMPTKQHGQIGEGPIQPEILKAEELEYADRVKQDPSKIMNQPEATKTNKTEQPKQTAKPEAKPTAPEQPAVIAQPSPAKPGEPVYDYIYQVASFKKQEMAQALSNKLASGGLTPEVKSGDVKGTTWYRVYVNHRGTPDSTAVMKATLAQNGIGKPLMRKKTPVE